MHQLLCLVQIVLLTFPVLVQSQTGGVKPQLMNCYNVSAIPGITFANSRPPANLNIFLEILRRLEDSNPTLTMRELSILLIQRLRQNGIISTEPMDLSIGIPFAPNSVEAIRGTIISQRYLANSTQKLDTGDLDWSEICAFHYMISNVINPTVRRDESQTCVRSSRYQLRIRRQAGAEDTETIETPSKRFGVPTGELSQCPIELGVIYTNYGTIKAGQVLQGLAAGYNMETVDNSDNRYAATLIGDLAHFALLRPERIGAEGGWNSTINPKYFFLQQNQYLALTDQDIRGSLDGLYMSLKLDSIRNRYSDIKLSQIVDMYYSPYQSGVFDPDFRACNRNILFTELITSKALEDNMQAFIQPLDDFGSYPGTYTANGYRTIVSSAINNFTNYLTQLSDLACPQLDTGIERTSTDLLIFLDSNWNFNTIQPIISYILDSIDVNKFGSRYTVFRGSDGANITSKSSRYLLDFHKQFNLTIHENLPKQFDYIKTYEVMETTVKSKLSNNSYNGGESTVVLIITKSTPSDSDITFLNQRKEVIKQFLPDVSVLVLGSDRSESYSSLLFNPSKDFIPLTETTSENDLKRIGQNVVEKIKTVPRSLVNPSCGPDFKGSQNSFSFSDSVDLYGTNYYKIAPNYFYNGAGTRTLRITEVSTGAITVCLSRDQSRPTNQTGDCQTLQSSVRSIDITGWCEGSNVQQCAPIYFSVYGSNTQYKCRDAMCRFPNNIKYTIALDDVGCASSAITVLSNCILVFLLFLFLRF